MFSGTEHGSMSAETKVLLWVDCLHLVKMVGAFMTTLMADNRSFSSFHPVLARANYSV